MTTGRYEGMVEMGPYPRGPTSPIANKYVSQVKRSFTTADVVSLVALGSDNITRWLNRQYKIIHTINRDR